MATTKCEISWIDPATGHDTGDDNDAIGVAYREAYMFDAGPLGQMPMSETRCFGICLDHAMRLNDVAMHRWHFVPFPLYVEHEVTRDYTRDRLATIADKWLGAQTTIEAEVDWGHGPADADPDKWEDDGDNDDTLPDTLPGMSDPHDDDTATGDQDSDDY